MAIRPEDGTRCAKVNVECSNDQLRAVCIDVTVGARAFCGGVEDLKLA